MKNWISDVNFTQFSSRIFGTFSKCRFKKHYFKTSLYHIGTRSNITGIESEEDIGIKKPKSFPLSSLADCLAAAAALKA